MLPFLIEICVHTLRISSAVSKVKSFSCVGPEHPVSTAEVKKGHREYKTDICPEAGVPFLFLVLPSSLLTLCSKPHLILLSCLPAC